MLRVRKRNAYASFCDSFVTTKRELFLAATVLVQRNDVKQTQTLLWLI